MNMDENIFSLEDADVLALKEDLYKKLQMGNYFSKEYKEIIKFYNKVCEECFKRFEDYD